MVDRNRGDKSMPPDLGTVAQALAPQQFEAILDETAQVLGPIANLEVVSGGLVHHVLRVTNEEEQSAYIKIRGEQFAQMPHIATDPTLIKNEIRALQIFSEHAPDYFPQVLHYNEELSYMVLSDVLPGAHNLAQQYRNRAVSTADLWHIGEALGSVHKKTRHVNRPVREPDDSQFQSTQFSYVFLQDSPELVDVAQEHAVSVQQIVMGDVWPKNILTQNGQVGFCDLEHAFLGTVQYDQASLLAAAMLHERDKNKARASVAAVIEGYNHSGYLDPSDELLCRTVAGLLLYRLEERVPYELPHSATMRGYMAQRINATLGQPTRDVNYIVDNLFRK